MGTPRTVRHLLLAGALGLLALSVATCQIDRLIKSSARVEHPILGVNPTAIVDSARAGSDDVREQTIAITNNGDGNFSWSASKDKGWISLDPTEGLSPGAVTASLDGHGLAPGTYNGTITVHAKGTPDSIATVTVTFMVQRAGLVVTPGSLTHSTNHKSNEEFHDQLDISNTGNGVLVWTASKSKSWITLGAVAGVGSGSVPLTISSRNLEPGTYSDEIVITAPGAEGSPARIPVTLNVFAPGLSVTPSAITESVDFGAFAPISDTLTVGISGGGALTWTATASAPWVTLSSVAGAAPPSSPVVVTLHPVGLLPATYTDTLVFVSPEAINGPIKVPVMLTVRGNCQASTLNPDDQENGALHNNDCVAPHRPGSRAELYTFGAGAGETFSIRMTASFNAYLILTDAGGTVLAQNDECPGESQTACINNFTVPGAGQYTIEATTSGPGETGNYSISIVRLLPPPAPQGLGQFRSDGNTAIGIGATTNEKTVVFKGAVSDPNTSDDVRLEIELEPLGSPFTNVSTHQSSYVQASRGNVSVSITVGSLNDAGYHWQARSCDQTSRCSAWLTYGGNDESSSDFVVNTAPPPPPPGGSPPPQGVRP